MDNNPTTALTAEQIYQFAANMMINEQRVAPDTVEALVNMGAETSMAEEIVANIKEKIKSAKKEHANKDILYGALWCGGGTIATLANIGFIFWGAILFGGIQLVKGIIAYSNIED